MAKGLTAIKIVAPTAGPGEKIIDGWPVTCSRQATLEARDNDRNIDNQYRECRKINKRPGYETLTKMRFGR